MPLGVRGFNPIWAEFDLQGNIFDDTYFMFVLQNTIPYIPAVVYHDPNVNVPWTSPIQFLANGTLPVDIFFESGVTYRLEFRKGPTQSDPLIYEVNNYIAGEGGNTPIDTVAFASSNQVTNPQFALINFDSPFTLSDTDPDPIQVGPGWFLELGGTGTVELEQVALNDDNINPSNAPYALHITLSGWDDGEVFLRQRFQQNGMLWANKIVSTTITAQLIGLNQTISASLVDSNNSILAQILSTTTVNQQWNEFTGYAELPETTNPDFPPAAFIDYKLALPSNIDIYVTSIQVVVQEEPFEPGFEQDSINRQIDHTYNTAYPIVPVGAVIDFAGFTIPEHYLATNGAALNRITYNLLFQALTAIETVTLTSALNTFTVTSSANYHIGMAIEGNGVPASTTISNIVGTTITMSNNATNTGPSAVRFFAWGAGDGSTTFNAPDLRDFVTAGDGGTLFSATNNAVGRTGGASTVTLTGSNMPNTVGVSSNASAGNFTFSTVGVNNVFGNGSGTFSQGSGTAVSIIQKTAIMKKCIRFE